MTMKNNFWIFQPVLIVSVLMIIGTVKEAFAQQTIGIVTDIDGNQYKTAIIGQQEWMVENLKTARLNDRTDIPNVTDSIQWVRVTSPAYSWYNNDISNRNFYGALYNWYAVSSGKLCPAGWRVPSDADWKVLTDFLGGTNIAGGKLKSTGVTHWNSPNSGATNRSGFSALPGGYRYGQYWYPASFYEKGINGYFWSATEYTETHSWSRTIHTGNPKVYRSFFTKYKGFSVRCIKGN